MPPRRRTNFQLARIFGIRVGVSASWFFVLFFLIYWLGHEYFPQIIDGLADDRLPDRGRGGVRVLPLADPPRARPRARRAPARHRRSSASTCGSSAGSRRCAASRRRPARSSRSRPPGRPSRSCCSCSASGVGEALSASAPASPTRSTKEGFTTTPALALLGWLAFVNAAAVRVQHHPRLPARRRADRPRGRSGGVTGDRNRATPGTGRAGQALAAGARRPRHRQLLAVELALRPVHDPARVLPLPGGRRGRRAGRARAGGSRTSRSPTSWTASR